MSRHRHPFSDVDRQPDPRAWIAVLDRLRQHPAYQTYKRRLRELLDARPGERYLEVGSGTGADALALEQESGATVVAVDASAAMAEEARRRGVVEVHVADARALPFPTASFAGAFADRTLQHVPDAPAAVAELARVVRPGGTVAAADPDYGTHVVNVRDQALAGRVLSFHAGVAGATLARQMPRIFAEAGLVDVRVEAVPVVLRDPGELDNALGLRDWARLAAEQGRLPADDVPAWERAIDEAAAGGWFLSAFCVLLTTGRRPPAQGG